MKETPTDLSPSQQLQWEFELRKQKNPSYSKRSFARLLGVSPTYLVRLMSGERLPTESRLREMGERLTWSDQLVKELGLRVRVLRAQNPRDTSAAQRDLVLQKEVRSYTHFPKKHIKLISKWHFSALLALLETDSRGEGISLEQLSCRLALNRMSCELALEALVDLGQAVRVKTGAERRYRRTKENITTGHVPSKAIRAHHREYLEKAVAALDEQDRNQRSITGTTFACDPERLQEAQEKIDRFRRELCAFLEGGEKKAVYRLSVELFRVDLEEARGS